MSRQARYGKNLAKYVKKVIDGEQERKIVEDNISRTINDEGAMIDISIFNEIARGVTLTQRQGESVDFHTLLLRFTLEIVEPSLEPSLPTFLNTTIRMVIFQWTDHPAENAPQPIDILTTYEWNSTTLASRTISPWSAYNKENVGKFKIMYDKLYTLSKEGQSCIAKKIQFTDMPIKTIPFDLAPINPPSPIIWNTTGSVYMLLVSDVDEELSEPPALRMVHRTIYTDS